MNATIQAQVNPRLLTKASRLFTGSLRGRITEILQNARRAGATQVNITNTNGRVTVHDDGRGIDSFEKLLDLGGSGWDEQTGLEASEDPAGVGLFCLAPRKLTVRSGGLQAVIEAEGWTGHAVSVRKDRKSISGTCLAFDDEPWDHRIVEPLAVFTGMKVTVDGVSCASEPFIEGPSAHHPELGCRVQVRTRSDLSSWHQNAARIGAVGATNVLVNFHGQTVGFNHRPVSDHDLYYLVELTGEPTGIRLMLPARTQLVENEVFEQLKSVVEREAFLHLQRLGRHHLPYEQYRRAQELGIALPEAEPAYQVGLLPSDGWGVDPAPVKAPEDWPLSRCYRLSDACARRDQTAEANAHLLAALGQCDSAEDALFIPVTIRPQFDGYSWADLPRIEQVEVETGKVLGEDWVWCGTLIGVESLKITARTSDGKTFRSDVCMAIRPEEVSSKGLRFSEADVYVTLEAQQRLADGEIWHHLGGFSDDGDTWETQQYNFARQLDAFWARLMGPDEPQRQRLLEAAQGVDANWQIVTIQRDGRVIIHRTDGTTKELAAPQQEGGC